MTIYYVDYEGGSDGNTGLSFAQRKKTIDSATALTVAGDTVRIMASGTPTSLGQSATWVDLNRTVTLTSAVTQFIADGQTNWTASANVTCTQNTVNVKYIKSIQFAVAAGFGTGLAAYLPTGTLDLSGYQQVSFYYRCTVNGANMKGFSLRLCSDAVGAVTVNTINIGDLSAGSNASAGYITVDTSGALGNNINSIALYRDSNGSTAVTFVLDCIIACKASSAANSLTLTSLLGWSDSTGAGGADIETWYGIASIFGTTVNLDRSPFDIITNSRGWTSQGRKINSSTNASPININATAHNFITGDSVIIQGHYGNTAANGTWTITVVDADNFTLNTSVGNGVGTATGAAWVNNMSRTTWKRETTKTAITSNPTVVIQAIGSSGSSGNPISITGGWNRIDMSTQTGETWYDGQVGNGIGIDFSNRSYINVSKIGSVRYNYGLGANTAASSNINVNSPGSNNNQSYGLRTQVAAHTNNSYTIVGLCSNGQAGFLGQNISTNTIFNILVACNNAGNGGIQSPGKNAQLIIGTASNNTGTGIILDSNCNLTVIRANNNNIGIGGAGTPANNYVIASIVANNTSQGISTLNTSFFIINTANNASSFDGTQGNFCKLKNCYFAEATKVSFITTFVGYYIFSWDENGTTGTFHIYTDGGDIINDTSTVHTAGGNSWKISPTSTNRAINYPFELSLARFTCVANTTYSIKAWTRRDSTTTLNSKILIKGGRINGVANDVSATASGSANTWEQLSISITPTESGVVELLGQVYDGTGTTNNAWFDDVTVNGVLITMDYLNQTYGPGAEPVYFPGNRFF